MCDCHDIVDGLLPCECDHVFSGAVHSEEVDAGDDDPCEVFGFGRVSEELGELGGDGIGDGCDLHGLLSPG